VSEAHLEARFTGYPISGGVAFAKACLLSDARHRNVPLDGVDAADRFLEKNRLLTAFSTVSEQLERVSEEMGWKVGHAESRIFQAQRTILTDSRLLEAILHLIDTAQVNAETATIRTIDGYQSQLLAVDNAFVRERADDLNDIQQRLLNALMDRHAHFHFHCSDELSCQRGCERVVVAEALMPSLTVGLHSESVRGFVTERGGLTSHAAILARGLGIPAVSGISGIHRLLDCGTPLIVDGNQGEVIAWPSAATISRLCVTAPDDTWPDDTWPDEVAPQASTVMILANISRAEEATLVIRSRADGIGLYRTEMEFIGENRILSEEEQYQRYVSVLQAMDGRPVCFRLLDIGGDKQAPFFGLPEEANRQLGCRGSRLLLERPDLLHPQARALARAAAHGPVDVLYPMIVDCSQFLKLKTAFQRATADLPAGDLRHGVMFEVPSACLQAQELLEHSHFASIGTNDLTQFLFALDRSSSHLYEEERLDHPSVWKLLQQVAEAARRTGRRVSICGEAAGEERFLAPLVQLGYTTLSVTPRQVPRLRKAASDAGL
jgi:phosphoenolpyruvate-protein phosphotransferase